MNVLDSPIEAMAFNPVNLGPLLAAVINNLWALVAVVTAAFSFWRLRSKTTSFAQSQTTSLLPQPQTTSSSPSSSSPTTHVVLKKTTSFGAGDTEKSEEEEEGVLLTRGNSSKELFTVYYDQDEERENDDVEDGDEMDGEDEMVVRKWARGLTVEIRGGDLGWYSYQDRGVISGNVVKLWEEERENGSPRSCRRRSSVGVTQLPLVFT